MIKGTDLLFTGHFGIQVVMDRLPEPDNQGAVKTHHESTKSRKVNKINFVFSSFRVLVIKDFFLKCQQHRCYE